MLIKWIDKSFPESTTWLIHNPSSNTKTTWFIHNPSSYTKNQASCIYLLDLWKLTLFFLLFLALHNTFDYQNHHKQTIKQEWNNTFDYQNHHKQTIKQEWNFHCSGRIKVHLDWTYCCWNWKYCSKIIFKCVYNTVDLFLIFFSA